MKFLKLCHLPHKRNYVVVVCFFLNIIFPTGRKKHREFYEKVNSMPMEDSRKVKKQHTELSHTLADTYNINHDLLRPYYLLYVGTIHDYCLWENEKLVMKN